MSVLACWMIGGALTLALYLGVALWVDGRVCPATWERFGLAVLLLLGPFGTALTLVLVGLALWDVRAEDWDGWRRVAGRLRRRGRRGALRVRRLSPTLRPVAAVPSGLVERMLEE